MKALDQESLEKLIAVDYLGDMPTLEFQAVAEELCLSFHDVDIDHKPVSLFSDSGELMSDLEAGRALYSALKLKGAIQESDSRIWTTLAFTDYKDYCASRWPMKAGLEKASRNAHVKSHYFIRTARDGERNHALARLWKMMRYIERVLPNISERAEQVLLGLNSDVPVQILGRPNIASSPNIMAAFIETLYAHYIEGGRKYNRDQVRNLLTELDLQGGLTVVPLMDSEKVSESLRARLSQVS
jgi:hypothetical protein